MSADELETTCMVCGQPIWHQEGRWVASYEDGARCFIGRPHEPEDDRFGGMPYDDILDTNGRPMPPGPGVDEMLHRLTEPE